MATLNLDPAAWAALGVIVTALVAAFGHYLGRRSSRDASKVDGYRAMADRVARVEGRQDVADRERALDQAWIALLRDHIYRGSPPPPPTRPTSL